MDLNTVQKVEVKITDEEKARQERVKARPPLSEILNLHDFEVKTTLSVVWPFEHSNITLLTVSSLTLRRLRKPSCRKRRGRIIVPLLTMKLRCVKTTLLIIGTFVFYAVCVYRLWQQLCDYSTGYGSDLAFYGMSPTWTFLRQYWGTRLVCRYTLYVFHYIFCPFTCSGPVNVVVLWFKKTGHLKLTIDV